MIKTLNKHIKWRRDKEKILICDCKRLIDLKMPFEFENTLRKIWRGVNPEDLNNDEKLLFLDFKKLKFLANLEIRQITIKEFLRAMEILDNELEVRVRDNKFLLKKFKEFPKFFIGIFLDNELIGIICGFPRDDYFLISELAVDSRFQERGFGKMLVKYFEKVVKKDYNRINVGAQDKVIGFYKNLGYKQLLFIQYKKGDYSLDSFRNINILKNNDCNNMIMLECEISRLDLNFLDRLRKKYPKAYFQYIFTKEL